MTTVTLHDSVLTISFTTAEKVAGLLRDQQLPLATIRHAEVVPDGLAAARGLRAPGLALPGRRKLGTWRSRSGKRLVTVSNRGPALRLQLAGHRFSEVLVTTESAEELVAALTRPGTAQEVAFTSGGHQLAGTLTVPGGTGPFPAVLLLPGSGPVDRDSDHKRTRLGITGQLADALDRAGVATFRYDKRGVGASPGDWRAAGFHDSRDDARTALELLATRPEVDATRLVVLGHSEGALHAASLAASDPGLAGVVLLSGAARSGEEVLRWQSAQIAPLLPRPVRALLRLMRTDLAARTAKTHAKIKATTDDVVRIEGARINARWFREFMAHDPSTDLARIHVPVLAITGGKDLQAPPADLATVSEVVLGPVEVHELADVSHILRRQGGPASLSGYKKEAREPLDPALVDLVTSWVRARVQGVASG